MDLVKVTQEERAYCREHLIPLLQKLIQNRCVNDGSSSSGNEIKNALLISSFFKEADIDSTILTPAKKELSNRASVVAYIEGCRSKPTTYGLMGHLDVVPANSAKWSFDPFCGDVDDEWIYGRGCVDMLNQVAIMASSLRFVFQRRGRPKESVKFIGVADEEADGILGAFRILKEHKELAFCDYLLSELGGYFIDSNHIAISVSEKGVLRLCIETFGTPAHGSMPYNADNAIYKMNNVICALNKIYENPFYTTQAINMINHLPLSDTQKKNLLCRESVYQELASIYKEKPALAKLIHSALFLTISVGVIKGGTKVNIIPDYCSVQLDVRLPHGVTNSQCIETMQSAFGEEVSITQLEYFDANSSPVNTKFMDDINSVVKEFYPDKTLVPVVPAGVSDARYWRTLTSLKAAYGFSLFSPRYSYDFFAKGLHGEDEKIDIDSLEVGFAFYSHLLSKILY